MSTDWKALCAELTDEWDAASGDPDMISFAIAIDRARAALAQPEPEVVGPTDEELLELLSRASGLPKPDSYIVDGGRIISEPCEILGFARAVLARWGRPAIKPVPVSERLPEAGDCDHDGNLWLLHRTGLGLWEWHFLNRYPNANSYIFYGYTHWLPAYALPLPTT